MLIETKESFLAELEMFKKRVRAYCVEEQVNYGLVNAYFLRAINPHFSSASTTYTTKMRDLKRDVLSKLGTTEDKLPSLTE